MTHSLESRTSLPATAVARRTQLRSTLAVLSGVLLWSCSVFDEELYKQAEGQPSGQQWSAIEDQCPYPAAKVLNSDTRYHEGTVKLNDLADDIQACGKLKDFDGPDGVIGIGLAAEERVHVEAQLVSPTGKTSPPVDMGVYMMNTCDPNTCLKRVDRCSLGGAEHFAWAANKPGIYHFGFDSKAYDSVVHQPELRVSVTFPRCGDGKLDKGETCDDEDRDSLDGCSKDCLAELTNVGQPVEVEPNNYYMTGNVVVLGSNETMKIKGHIGGGCDLDFFMLDIPEGGFARAKLLAEDGKNCPPGTPPLVLEFDDPSGVAELGKAKIPAEHGGANHCPEWDETSFVTNQLPAGRYVVAMKPYDKGNMEVFAYVLQVEVLAAGTGGAGGTSGAGGGSN